MSSKSVISFFGVILVVSAVAGFLSFKMQSTHSTVPAEIADSSVPEIVSLDVHSIYGDMNANIEETTQSTGNRIYSVTTQDLDKKGEKVLIYQIAYPNGVSLSLPANTWSPSNNYIFLKEETSSGASYLVFRSSGELFSNGEKYINASEVFKLKMPNFVLKNITGWDSDSLLHAIAADSKNENNLSKFWIEIPSGAVYRLAR